MNEVTHHRDTPERRMAPHSADARADFLVDRDGVVFRMSEARRQASAEDGKTRTES